MGKRKKGFLCCFSRSPPPKPPPSSAHICVAHAASAIERNGSKHSPPNQGNVQVLQQQQQIQKEVQQIEEKLESLKGDLAREMGYPLATRLIHEVSAVFDPNVEKMSLHKHPNPWGWLQRNVDFKRALGEQGDTVPKDMKSVEAIAFQAARIMAHSNRKFIKCYPEVLYMELKDFKDKGYMEALSARDPDLHSFLDLSSFFASAFIARPRLLQLTTFMLQRVRDELAIYWHTWEKLPFSWDERWHEAEMWFQAAVDCFKEHNNSGEGAMLPKTIIELAREFDVIEETTRKIYGVNRVKEVGTFEQILQQYEQMKESNLLTLEVQKQNPLCYAFLEYSPEIKNGYMAMVETKHEMDGDRKTLSVKLVSSSTYQDYQGSSQYDSSRSKLGSSSRAKSERSSN